MAPRKDISLDQIVEAMGAHGSKADAARVLGCSKGLIYRRMLEHAHKGSSAKKCSCCESKLVAPGNRMLCNDCYARGAEK